VLTKSQVELVLGQEGAAVLEYIAHMWQQERQTIDGLKDVTYSQLVQGIVALCCLQRVRRVGYGSKGFVLHRSMGIADKEAEDWRWQEEQHMGGGRDSAHELRRSMHISSLCYSVLLDMVVGSGKTKASSALLGSRRENLVAALNLRSKDDVVAAQWETEGPHAPGYLLIADRRGGGADGPGYLTLAIRGTIGAGDALTDLRCDAATLSASLLPGFGQCRVHRGMWESAVRMDGNLRHTIEEAIAPGGPCEGMRLRVVGHSLGAGVASLLTLRWHEMVPLFRQHGVHCHAFGPPCVLDESAAAATCEYMTSVVVGDDAVCRWSLGSTKDVLHSAALLGQEAGATQRLLRMALACLALPDQGHAPRDAAGDGGGTESGRGAEEGGDARKDGRAAEAEAMGPALDVRCSTSLGATSEARSKREARSKCEAPSPKTHGRAGAWDDEMLEMEIPEETSEDLGAPDAGAARVRDYSSGSRTAAAAAAAAAAATAAAASAFSTAEDLEWSMHMLQSLETCVEASDTEKLLPAGRIVWLLHPAGRRGSGGGEGGRAGTDGGAESSCSRVAYSTLPQVFKGPRTLFSKLIFTRRMLTDHVPLTYVWAIDGSACLCVYLYVFMCERHGLVLVGACGRGSYVTNSDLFRRRGSPSSLLRVPHVYLMGVRLGTC
jgi:hypothetical protein